MIKFIDKGKKYNVAGESDEIVEALTDAYTSSTKIKVMYTETSEIYVLDPHMLIKTNEKTESELLKDWEQENGFIAIENPNEKKENELKERSFKTIEINGSKTIMEAAKEIFGNKLKMSNKALALRLESEPCEEYCFTNTTHEFDGGFPVYSFISKSSTFVEGCEFKFSVSTRFTKKTGTIKLVSDH